MTNTVLVQRLTEEATVPTQAHENDAGWDLYSIEDISINGGERRTIKTGIAFQIPNGHAGLIWPRSGLAVKKGLDILAGVIDSDYRGEIKVCLFNSTIPLPLWETPQSDDVRVDIKKGDRIAQIIFHSLPKFILMEVYSLNDTERSMSGFGSSGT
ncbi:dUTP diphosphatase [Methanosarcinales archaeon]|nr:MAG: dUTP diphosphatase [Methanosarcinales archaeon]